MNNKLLNAVKYETILVWSQCCRITAGIISTGFKGSFAMPTTTILAIKRQGGNRDPVIKSYF